jgi:hypothetical protein
MAGWAPCLLDGLGGVCLDIPPYGAFRTQPWPANSFGGAFLRVIDPAPGEFGTAARPDLPVFRMVNVSHEKKFMGKLSYPSAFASSSTSPARM